MRKAGLLAAIAVTIAAFIYIGTGDRAARMPERSAEPADTAVEKPTSPDAAASPREVRVRGRVLAAGGGPVPGAAVEAIRPATLDLSYKLRFDAAPEGVAARATAAADGSYELRVPLGAAISLRARAAGYAQAVLPEAAFAADAAGVDFLLEAGGPVAGWIVDDRGRPLRDASVLWLAGQERIEAPAGADGAFSLRTREEAGALVARAPGHAPRHCEGTRAGTTDLRIVLGSGMSVRLRVVEGERKAPIEGALVFFTCDGACASGTTETEGVAVVRDLPLRDDPEFEIYVQRAGYVPGWDELTGRPAAGGFVDLGDFEMDPGLRVEGRVLDGTTGKGVPDARVRSFGGLVFDLEAYAAPSAVTAADGRFVLEGVPREASQVLAYHPDYAMEGHPDLFAFAMSGGSPLGPTLGETEGWIEVNLVPVTALSGIVTSPGGRPVRGAVVEVSDREDQVAAVLGGAASASVTDEQGRFMLGRVRRGDRVHLAATHGDYGMSAIVEVVGGAEQPVTLKLTEPSTVEGRVVDDEGRPIASARASVAKPLLHAVSGGSNLEGAEPPAPLVRVAFTDADGRFRIRGAPSGEVMLKVDHPAYLMVTRRVTLRAGDFDAGSIALPRGASIEGIVVDDAGAPIGDATVEARHRGLDDEPAPGRTDAGGKSDAQGGFVLRGLRSGEYTLQVGRKWYYAPEKVVRADAAPLRIVMTRAVRLAGRVMSGGMPVAGAMVTAMTAFRGGTGPLPEQRGWSTSGADGTFVVEPLPPGELLDLTITHDRYRLMSARGINPADPPRDYSLDPGLCVGGVVVLPDGSPVKHATVDVAGKFVRTDEKGAFLAGGLDQQKVMVQLREAWRFVPSEPIEAVAGDRSVRLVAVVGETIKGTLKVDPKPGTSLQVEALDRAGKVWANRFASGPFELGVLPAGTYTVRVTEVRWKPGTPWEERKERIVAERHDVAAGTKDLEIVVGD